MPRVLTEADVADFRERLCQVAERLFAERGFEGMTMRQLAAELGVSPMTPYRYFEDKDEILAAVRASGFERFSAALETARASTEGARAKGAAIGEAYIAFAFAHPNTYKLMFDLHQPDEERYPDLARATQRARATLTGWVEDLISDGYFSGDPVQIGRMYWAAAHGAVVLEMSGRLPQGAARELHRQMRSTLAKGLGAHA